MLHKLDEEPLGALSPVAELRSAVSGALGCAVRCAKVLHSSRGRRPAKRGPKVHHTAQAQPRVVRRMWTKTAKSTTTSLFGGSARFRTSQVSETCSCKDTGR